MTNKDALKALCLKICSNFYPDTNVIELSLLDNGMYPEDEYIPKDISIVKQAIEIVQGMANSDHSENGIDNSWDLDKIDSNIRSLCKKYGLDVSEFVDVPTIEDGSHLM